MGDTAMLLGQATLKLDEKNRITIPSKFREYFNIHENIKSNEVRLVISRGFEGCLVIRSVKEFKIWQEKILQQSEALKEGRILSRQIFANSEIVTSDNKGRITISIALLNMLTSAEKNEKDNNKAKDIKFFKKIEKFEEKKDKEFIIIGVSNKLELWLKEDWNSFNEQTKNQLEEVAASLKEF